MIFAALLALAAVGPVHAFQLGEHASLTRQAVDEFNLCAGGLVAEPFKNKLVSANRFEDLDLFNKWLTYSHFFHPTKILADQRRLDSSIRIIELESRITGLLDRAAPELEDAFQELGYAIHHIQDASSPPHVVPVMHGLGDGFEGMELAAEELPDFELSPARCRELQERARRGDSLLSILDDTATITLAAVKAATLDVVRDGRAERLTWEAFWKESSGNSFGSAGILGDTFGDLDIVTKQGRYRVTRATYARFKAARLRGAIDATRRVLAWFAAKEWGR